MIKMIGFDLDGTICDSLPLCIQAFKNAVEPYIGHDLTEEEIAQTFGLNEAGIHQFSYLPKGRWLNCNNASVSFLIFFRIQSLHNTVPGHSTALHRDFFHPASVLRGCRSLLSCHPQILISCRKTGSWTTCVIQKLPSYP